MGKYITFYGARYILHGKSFGNGWMVEGGGCIVGCWRLDAGLDKFSFETNSLTLVTT